MDERTALDADGPRRTPPDDELPRQPHRPPLSARAAASELGVNERTVRRWIDQGQLAAVKVRGSYRIHADEIERARVAILGDGLTDVRSAALPDEPDEAGVSGQTRAAAAAAATGGAAPAAISSAAMAQLEAIRDQWLQPLIDRVGALERENGGLEERLTATARERDALRAEVERLRAAPEPPPEQTGDNEDHRPATEALMLRWRRWYRRMVDG